MAGQTSPVGINESLAEAKTLWIGDLAYWCDETWLTSLFAGTGALESVKVIRDKATSASAGYGFITFSSHTVAESVLTTYNGVPIPNTDLVFRLNWAAFGVGKITSEADHSVFVGDLAPEVNDYALQEHFRQYFSSVRSAKVITDPVTGRSKGYGFVRFGNEGERDRSLNDMMGHYIASRPIRVSLATAKKNPGGLQAANAAAANAVPHPSDYDPTNTTLFIGGLSAGVSEDDLRTLFGRFGEIVYTKIPPGKGCGFVQFVQRAAAEAAMAAMQGQVVGQSSIRISWGRSSTANRGPAAIAAAALGAPGYSYPGVGVVGAPPAYGAAYPGYDAGAYGFAGTAPPAADPYAAYYAAIAADPAAYQAYQQPAAGGMGAFAAASQAPAPVPGKPKPEGYDPLAPIDVDKLNSAFIHRHQAALLGAHLRAR
ncbi:hypothetical protein WJX81_001458 [Elliptochloris bilobata]|uniref:RRM domain-containing protein n=1 Tax=Elliptochloris bilobata TaxID=381761 RepID=A0AAW1R2W4_9CHLO